MVFIATGSEVGLAIQSAALLSRPVRVVSMPCIEQFHAQSEEYQSKVIPRFVQKVVIEAGSPHGWRDAIDGTKEDTLVIGIDRYGASAPAKVIGEKLGFTPEGVVAKVKERFFRVTS